MKLGHVEYDAAFSMLILPRCYKGSTFYHAIEITITHGHVFVLVSSFTFGAMEAAVASYPSPSY